MLVAPPAETEREPSDDAEGSGARDAGGFLVFGGAGDDPGAAHTFARPRVAAMPESGTFVVVAERHRWPEGTTAGRDDGGDSVDGDSLDGDIVAASVVIPNLLLGKVPESAPGQWIDFDFHAVLAHTVVGGLKIPMHDATVNVLHERRPDVACNPIRVECLVVFEVDYSLQGQRSNFIIVSQRVDPVSLGFAGPINPVGAFPNHEVRARVSHATAPGRSGDEGYAVVFEYDTLGDGSDWDIAAQLLSPDGAFHRDHPHAFYVAAGSDAHESFAEIAFLPGTGAHLIAWIDSLRGAQARVLHVPTEHLDEGAWTIVAGYAPNNFLSLSIAAGGPVRGHGGSASVDDDDIIDPVLLTWEDVSAAAPGDGDGDGDGGGDGDGDGDGDNNDDVPRDSGSGDSEWSLWARAVDVSLPGENDAQARFRAGPASRLATPGRKPILAAPHRQSMDIGTDDAAAAAATVPSPYFLSFERGSNDTVDGAGPDGDDPAIDANPRGRQVVMAGIAFSDPGGDHGCDDGDGSPCESPAAAPSATASPSPPPSPSPAVPSPPGSPMPTMTMTSPTPSPTASPEATGDDPATLVVRTEPASATQSAAVGMRVTLVFSVTAPQRSSIQAPALATGLRRATDDGMVGSCVPVSLPRRPGSGASWDASTGTVSFDGAGGARGSSSVALGPSETFSCGFECTVTSTDVLVSAAALAGGDGGAREPDTIARADLRISAEVLAQVELAATVDPETAPELQPATVDLIVSNAGPANATDVVVDVTDYVVLGNRTGSWLAGRSAGSAARRAGGDAEAVGGGGGSIAVAAELHSFDATGVAVSTAGVRSVLDLDRGTWTVPRLPAGAAATLSLLHGRLALSGPQSRFVASAAITSALPGVYPALPPLALVVAPREAAALSVAVQVDGPSGNVTVRVTNDGVRNVTARDGAVLETNLAALLRTGVLLNATVGGEDVRRLPRDDVDEEAEPVWKIGSLPVGATWNLVAHLVPPVRIRIRTRPSARGARPASRRPRGAQDVAVVEAARLTARVSLGPTSHLTPADPARLEEAAAIDAIFGAKSPSLRVEVFLAVPVPAGVPVDDGAVLQDLASWADVSTDAVTILNTDYHATAAGGGQASLTFEVSSFVSGQPVEVLGDRVVTLLQTSRAARAPIVLVEPLGFVHYVIVSTAVAPITLDVPSALPSTIPPAASPGPSPPSGAAGDSGDSDGMDGIGDDSGGLGTGSRASSKSSRTAPIIIITTLVGTVVVVVVAVLAVVRRHVANRAIARSRTRYESLGEVELDPLFGVGPDALDVSAVSLGGDMVEVEPQPKDMGMASARQVLDADLGGARAPPATAGGQVVLGEHGESAGIDLHVEMAAPPVGGKGGDMLLEHDY